jgi:hypothetical protein
MIMKTTKKSKASRKLLPAIAMLAMSATMLATSTYAWFSMNKDVTLTGMSVTAKSDSTFLLVKAGTATASEIQTAKLIEDDAVTASAVLYPAAHDNITEASTGYSDIEAADDTVATDKDIWYYRYNRNPAASTDNMTDITYVPVANFGEYVLLNEFSLTVADGSNNLSDLRVKSCSITTAGDQAVKVLVAGANGCQEFSGAGTAADYDDADSNVLQTAAVTSSGVSTVKVYVYWDGNDADVYTNGIADLQNTAVTVELTGDVVPAT